MNNSISNNEKPLMKKSENYAEIEKKVEKYYEEEYNENFEYILIKKDGEFLKFINDNVKYLIEEKLLTEIYEKESFINKIKEIEKNLYYKKYTLDKELLIKTLKEKNIDYIEKGENFFFLKHCKFQSNIPYHKCNKKNNFIIIPNEENPDKIYGIICTNCLHSYKSNLIKLYCDFCQIDYFTKIINNENNIYLQPATWEKYHCRLIINQQMGCIKCKKSNLFLNLKDNKLICKKCGFSIEQNGIIWTCVKCGLDFRSNAKIYNPYNTKGLSLAIKKGINNKISAVPNKIPCGHNPNNIFHKRDCNGKIYISYYNGRKIVVCSKCKAIVKYNKFIFECSECFKRFRAEINDDEKLNEEREINKVKAEKQIVDDFYKNILQINNLNLNSNQDDNYCNNYTTNEEINTNDNTNHSDYIKDSEEKLKKIKNFKDVNNAFLEYKINPFEKEEKKNEFKKKDNELSKGNITLDYNFDIKKKGYTIPLFDLNEYEIVSQVGESIKSKIYCVRKKNDNSFYKLKRRTVKSQIDSENYLNVYELQYRLSNILYITKVYGVYYNENEINILTECGIGTWASEIMTYKKMKKYYSENDLINIIYQISYALSLLEEKQLCHFCVNPFNIIIFKDKIYKINDFEHLMNITSKKIIKNENKFISPNLNYLYRSKDLNEKINLIKNDVYSLGLCIIYTLIPTDDVNSLYGDFVNIDKLCNVPRKIKNYIYKIIQVEKDENLYSEKFINLLCKMMNNIEEERFNFFDVINYISKEYKIEVKI